MKDSHISKFLVKDFPAKLTVGGNNGCIPPTLEGWVYIIPIHGPLDGPLYMGSIYSNTIYMREYLIVAI